MPCRGSTYDRSGSHPAIQGVWNHAAEDPAMYVKEGSPDPFGGSQALLKLLYCSEHDWDKPAHFKL